MPVRLQMALHGCIERLSCSGLHAHSQAQAKTAAQLAAATRELELANLRSKQAAEEVRARHEREMKAAAERGLAERKALQERVANLSVPRPRLLSALLRRSSFVVVS